MESDPVGAWREERRRAVEAHGRAQQEAQAARAAQARRLISDFLRAAAERGVAPTALTAPAHRGRLRYRTRLRGWYLDAGRSLAVDTDGEFYVLGVPNSIKARLAGADPTPQPPPLVIGEGGRDGESIPLKDLLQRRLDEGS